MKYKILMIVNPKAGKARVTKYVPQIKENLHKLNYDIVVKYTTKQNNATCIIKEYEDDYEVLLIFGGDGTLNEAVQGICEANKKVLIGFIPVGTTNDFAKSLKVSFDKLNISKEINQYVPKQIDLGIFNDRTFIYSATFGIFTKCSYKASTKWKNRIGRLAYILLAIKDIFDYKIYKIKIKTNEKEIEDEFIFGSISNSQYIGGFNMFKRENIKLNDGKFEVLLVKKPKNFVQLIKLALKVINGNMRGENIYYFQTDYIDIEAADSIEWAIDGECGGKNNKVKIYNINKFIDFIVPKED